MNVAEQILDRVKQEKLDTFIPLPYIFNVK